MADPVLAQGIFSSRIPHFFDLLSKLETGIPIPSQWVVLIHQFPEDIIEKVRQYENYAGVDDWKNVRIVVDKLAAGYLQKTKGCIFANQVTIPGESVAIEHAGEGYRGGYVKGPITPNRADFGNFTVNFLETNLSFGDLVIRPWTIMVGHQGLLVRETENINNTIKTNINVFHLAKAGADVPLIIRKQFNFYNCVPISISSEDYDYEPQSQTKMRQVEFLFSYYTVDTGRTIAPEPGPPEPPPPTPRGHRPKFPA